MKYKGYYSEEWQKDVDEKVADEVRMAMEEAEKEPAPEPETMFSDVFKDMPWHLENQQAMLLEHLTKYPKAEH